MQDDKKLLKRVDNEFLSVKEAVRVVTVRERHHALQLWESICQTGEALEELPPLLLMPEGYAFAGEKDELLLEMAKVFRVNQLVSQHGWACSLDNSLQNA